MKIRSGFVSNSSSSSYVIYVNPNYDFKSSKYATKEYWESVADEPEDFDCIETDMMKYISSLLKGEEMYEDGDNSAFFALTNALDDMEKDNAVVCLSVVSVSSDGGTIVPVSKKNIDKVKEL